MYFSSPAILICALVLALITPALGHMADTAEPETGPEHIQIEMRSGSLTLEARDAALFDVLQAIGGLAGFKTVLIDEDVGSIKVSATFKNASIKTAVERLIRDTNRVVFYKNSPEAADYGEISTVWLMGKSSESGANDQNPEELVVLEKDLENHEGKSRSEAALRLSSTAASAETDDRVLIRLTQLLEGDHDALVRARAATALGALGNPKAFQVLESALADSHPTVRAQAINSLGQIGGDQSTRALGNLLLYGSANPLARVMAAQSLWRIDTEVARRYLRTGSFDANEQVRKASSKGPSHRAIRNVTDIQGAEESQ